MGGLHEIDHVPMSLASPEKIRNEWSYGEIMLADTINYRTLKPVMGGLFCERIFGPTKDYRCGSNCKHYANEQYDGMVCPKCGVEVTKASVRRERMGHIELETPIAHFWYFNIPSKNYIGTILNIPNNHLERIIYCNAHVVMDEGDTELQQYQLLSTAECEKERDHYLDLGYGEREGQPRLFRSGTGAEVVEELLRRIDLPALKIELEEQVKNETSKQRKTKVEKRLQMVIDFIESGNRPEWMILKALPVTPPDLRPMVPLDGGRFASTDLNDLYRRVINRNNRLKRLKELEAPNLIVENEKKLLQEAVDQLISNAKTSRPATGIGGRVLKSLEDSLKGKQGRFRQNLLGKRVDYSGRSVIISGPFLRIHQCGIPARMAIELFKPFVMHHMVKQNKARNAKGAKRKIEAGHEDVWGVLEQVMHRHPVLLNRAPTLHRLSVRAFEPVLIDGLAIRLHPLVCSAFNADFDGDQMAVHVPLSREAQAEAHVLMMASENLINPQNGKSSSSPAQDMVLGCHYLTIEQEGAKGEGSYYPDEQDALIAYESGNLSLHARIILDVRDHPKVKGGKYLITTIGKILFNQSMPSELVYLNDSTIKLPQPDGLCGTIEEAQHWLKNKPNTPFSKSFLGKVVDYAYDSIGNQKTSELLDGMMDVGFKYAMKGGISISLFDVSTPDIKQEVMDKADEDVKEIGRLYAYGRITDEYRHTKVVETWTKATNHLAKEAYNELMEKPMNSIAMMMVSGSRGNNAQYRQLAANRGLMTEPSGRIIERAIKSNFTEGLSTFEYFTSTHGARKGMADSAIKTANAGYLTRRLVDVAQDVIVTEEDCHTKERFIVEAIVPEIEPLWERLDGRYLGETLVNEDGEIIAKEGVFITTELAQTIEKHFNQVAIRSVISCATKRGVCSKCYGMDMSNLKPVQVGEAVGVISAQSIGEPGTQLTMRTFHLGGVAGEDDITQGLPRVEEIFEARKLDGNKSRKAVLAEIDGIVEIREIERTKEVLIYPSEGEPVSYEIKYGYGLLVKNGDAVTKGTALTTGSINPHQLLRLRGIETVQHYLLTEVQRVYRSQGVSICDKHIEVIINQMTKHVQIIHPGSSDLTIGRLYNRFEVKAMNEVLKEAGQEEILYVDKIQGVKEAALSVESFLSAASFEQTSRSLAEAAVRGKRDMLIGLKESVIVGKQIPAGTGYYK